MLTQLSEIIKQKSKALDGSTGNCIHLNIEKITLNNYADLSGYQAKAGDVHTEITFSKFPYHYIFSTAVKEKREDRKSFEKFGGLIYIIEPLTDDIAKVILSTLK